MAAPAGSGTTPIGQMTGTVSSTNRRMTSPAPQAHAALGKQVRAMKTMRSSRYVNERLLTLAWRSKAAVPLSTRTGPSLPCPPSERTSVYADRFPKAAIPFSTNVDWPNLSIRGQHQGCCCATIFAPTHNSARQLRFIQGILGPCGDVQRGQHLQTT